MYLIRSVGVFSRKPQDDDAQPDEALEGPADGACVAYQLLDRTQVHVQHREKRLQVCYTSSSWV